MVDVNAYRTCLLSTWAACTALVDGATMMEMQRCMARRGRREAVGRTVSETSGATVPSAPARHRTAAVRPRDATHLALALALAPLCVARLDDRRGVSRSPGASGAAAATACIFSTLPHSLHLGGRPYEPYSTPAPLTGICVLHKQAEIPTPKDVF